jgi:hypothetical protein
MKIAPTLADVIDGIRPRDRQDIPRVGRVIREYRALLAVARAANVWSLTSPASPAFPGVESRLVRALTRLEKTSR